MKIFTPLARNLAVALASAFAATMVSGAPLAYTPGDLFLAFRATGNPGATQDYLVNIGPASSFTSATSVTQLTGIGNIRLDLANNIFGPNWHSRSDVLWSISGTPGSASAAGDPANTLYVTAPEETAGVLASPHTRANSAAQSAPTNKLTSLATAYLQTAGTPNNASANSAVALIQSTTDINSYASFQSLSSNYGYFSATIEGNFGNGTESSILDLYRLIPSNDPSNPVSTGTPGQLVGRFTINDQAEVTFTPAAKIGVARCAAEARHLLHCGRCRYRHRDARA